MTETNAGTSAGGSVLVVCTGNVCRSPLVERLLQRDLAGTGIRVGSAGTGALVGAAMDPRAAADLVARGADPDGFVARQLTPQLVAAADLVLTATRRQRGEVASLEPAALGCAFTLGDFADLVEGLSTHVLAVGLGERRWLPHVVQVVAARRGRVTPKAPEEVDIVDPYRREDAVFAAMTGRVMQLLPPVVRALTPPLPHRHGRPRGPAGA